MGELAISTVQTLAMFITGPLVQEKPTEIIGRLLAVDAVIKATRRGMVR